MREFRISWPIRAAALGALLAWLAVGVFAAAIPNVPGRLFWAIGFFVAFFVGSVAYYFNFALVVHEYGLTYRGVTDFEHFDWEEILHIRDSPMPLGGYMVTTTRGAFTLNGFVEQHDALVELIIARAGLFPT